MPESGVGSEVHVGKRTIGVAARERTPIRLGYALQEYRSGQPPGKGLPTMGMASRWRRRSPFPGFADAASQPDVPLVVAGRLRGVL